MSAGAGTPGVLPSPLISMSDLLSPEDSAAAKKMGWQVTEVYDLRTKSVVHCVLPANNVARWNQDVVMQRINNLARAGHTPAINTLRALVRRPSKGRK